MPKVHDTLTRTETPGWKKAIAAGAGMLALTACSAENTSTSETQSHSASSSSSGHSREMSSPEAAELEQQKIKAEINRYGSRIAMNMISFARDDRRSGARPYQAGVEDGAVYDAIGNKGNRPSNSTPEFFIRDTSRDEGAADSGLIFKMVNESSKGVYPSISVDVTISPENLHTMQELLLTGEGIGLDFFEKAIKDPASKYSIQFDEGDSSHTWQSSENVKTEGELQEFGNALTDTQLAIGIFDKRN